MKATAVRLSRYILTLSLFLSFPASSLLPLQIQTEVAAAAAQEPAQAERLVPAADGPGRYEKETEQGRLQRVFDPVIIQGEWLGAPAGTPLAKLRLYRYVDRRFEAIRFQLDERTPDGDWVFPHGKGKSRAKGNGLLDAQDVLLFMAKDAGEQKDRTVSLQRASSVLEIGLEDPVDEGRAWVYLAVFEDRPPPLCPLPDYVRYNYETEEVASDYFYSRFIITEDGLHTSFSDIGAILPPAGGSGENRMDRMKTRIQIRFFFNLIPLSLHEEMLGQDVAAYITGPVRVIRRMEQFFKLPLGFRGLRSFTDVHLYESLTMIPAEIHVPKGAQRIISSSDVWFGADLAPSAIGSLFRNSENHEPLIIDGRMSEAERRFPPQQDKWRVFYGPTGAMVMRAVFPAEYLQLVEIRQRYVDDLSVSSPPERYEGSIGLLQTEVVSKQPPAGRYRIRMEVCVPPHYREGDETACLNVGENPLRIRIRGSEHVNRPYMDR